MNRPTPVRDLQPLGAATSSTLEDAQNGVSLRERNKRNKLMRIRAAAEELFDSEGYDAATMRAIAQRADVGLGTLFSYAVDKRDLLFLVNNDTFRRLSEDAAAALNPDAPLLEELMSLFSGHYVFFSRRPQIARTMLRELNFYKDTVQATRFQQTREHVHGLVRQALGYAKARGEIAPTVDDLSWARLIFGAYQMEIRAWLNEEPLIVQDGLARLEASLRLLRQGF